MSADEEDDITASPDRPGLRRTARLEAFSDGIFAIAITLLVLDLAVPPIATRNCTSWTR